MEMGFDAIIATDGQEFNLGKSKIRVLHTPGHTMESAVFLLINEAGKEEALFTGDTVFIGDVGRPDLFPNRAGELDESQLEVLQMAAERPQLLRVLRQLAHDPIVIRR